jgi:hypothetical protein
LPPETPEPVLAAGAVSTLIRRNGDLALVSHDRSVTYATAPGEPGDAGVFEVLLERVPLRYGAQREDLRRMQQAGDAADLPDRPPV